MKKALPILFVILWPFLVFYPFVTSSPQHGLGIGNDFIKLSYNYKVYLLDFLCHLHFPLWSPGEAAGFPFYSNPYAQAFYPFNLFLMVFYRIAGGYSPVDHLRFAVLGISIFSLGIFLWLQRLRIPSRPALTATCIMVIGFKCAELLRFPGAVHTAAWYPWILWAIGGIFQVKGWRSELRWGAALLGFFLLLFLGGHPYFFYYAFFLIVPYLGLLSINPLRKMITHDSHGSGEGAFLAFHPREIFQKLGIIALGGIVAVGICSPYLLKMSQLLQQTSDRSGGNYTYSLTYPFTPLDTLGSLIFPPSAQAEGWYYFGILPLLLILLMLAIPGRSFAANGDDPVVRWVRAAKGTGFILLGWIALLSYLTYGDRSILFRILWQILPFFSSLRAWGRMNIILIPLFAWMLALSLQMFEFILQKLKNLGDSRKRNILLRNCFLILGASGMVIFGLQFYLLKNQIFDEEWISFFRANYYWNAPSFGLQVREWLFSIFGILGLVILGAIILGARCRILTSSVETPRRGVSTTIRGVLRSVLTSRRMMWGMSLGLMVFSAADMTLNRYGAWLTDPYSPTRRPLNTAAMTREAFTTPRTEKGRTITLTSQFAVNTLTNWYFARYQSFLDAHAQEPEAMHQLLGINDGSRLFFSRKIDHPSVQAYLNDCSEMKFTWELNAYTGDILAVEIRNPQAGYLSYIDNWDADWQVFVDDLPAPLLRLFGTFKSVYLEAGTHFIRFVYQPALGIR